MCKIFGVLNYKGGTGKTTTVINLAAGLALSGSRVLCVDMDAQGSLATSLGVTYTHTMTDLLLGRVTVQQCIIPTRDNLDIIPSDATLLQAEGALWRMNDSRAARQVLADKMCGIEDDYDYIILDYSPSVSLLSENGLAYAQKLIVPVSPNYMALIGIKQVIQTLKTIGQKSEHRVELSMIVPTFYYSHLRKDREVMATLHRYFGVKVVDPIRINVKLSEASGHQMSIYEYAPYSSGAADYAQLVERVIHEN